MGRQRPWLAAVMAAVGVAALYHDQVRPRLYTRGARRDEIDAVLLARGSGGAIGRVWFDAPHFVMEQKMLRGIRDRAQNTRHAQVVAISRPHRTWAGAQ